VGWPQILMGTALVLALLALSFYYGPQQLLALRRLRTDRDLPEEERRFEKRRAWWRMINSVLTLALAILIAGALLFLETPAQRLADQGIGEAKTITPGERDFLRVYGWYWVTTLLVLLAVVLLAAWDLFATRRWGLREKRKLNAERRAMLERQVNRLRQERNGAG
jgi:hypothetical protein